MYRKASHKLENQHHGPLKKTPPSYTFVIQNPRGDPYMPWIDGRTLRSLSVLYSSSRPVHGISQLLYTLDLLL